MMLTKPLVSVIMPAYECEKYVAKAIQSVLQQSYTNWELLIGDDASQDGTLSIILSIKDSRIKIYKNSTNQGNVVTRNNLFSNASGEFITVLDADDWMENNKLEEQLLAFERDKELKACFTNYFEIDVQGKQNKMYNLEQDYYLNKKNFTSSFCSMPATIMVKSEVYREVGGLHNYFSRLFAEDKYWICKIIEKHKTILLKRPLYFYRTNPFSLTNSIDNPRKLTIVELVNELIRQRQLKNSDWLSEGNLELALAFEDALMKNRKWLGEQYRIHAAHQIDLLRLKEARKLLKESFNLYPYNFSIARTLLYLLRRIPIQK
jgi:glycosyltransferase involved in cell wall biosynthesis